MLKDRGLVVDRHDEEMAFFSVCRRWNAPGVAAKLVFTFKHMHYLTGEDINNNMIIFHKVLSFSLNKLRYIVRIRKLIFLFLLLYIYLAPLYCLYEY